jgi:hypothetical protein
MTFPFSNGMLYSTELPGRFIKILLLLILQPMTFPFSNGMLYSTELPGRFIKILSFINSSTNDLPVFERDALFN